MLKVICIDAKGLRVSTYGLTIHEGADYSALDRRILEGTDCYLIYTLPIEHWYDVKRFIPLSDIDELELANEQSEALCQ